PPLRPLGGAGSEAVRLSAAGTKSRPAVGVVLEGLHGVEVSNQIIELAIGELGMRWHAGVAERERITHVGLDLVHWAILDDALRNIEIGPDSAAFTVDRMTRDALALEDRIAGVRWRVGRCGDRCDVRVEVLRRGDFDLDELVGPRVMG